MRTFALLGCNLALALAACSKPPAETGPVPAITPNDFLAGVAPTFIVGTLGDDGADLRVRGQAEFIRSTFFPASKLMTDVDAGSSWPERPVLYGGPNLNAMLHDIAPGLPFELDATHLSIGGQTLKGDDLQLITVLPAQTGDSAHPPLLLYAGTGPVGVAEINAVTHGTDPILVADVFGPLYTGRWVRAADGTLAAELGPAARRIAWRDVKRTSDVGATSYRFPADLAAAPDESDLIDAAEKGLARAVNQLGLKSYGSLTIYVHPDVRSKQALTGNAGDGHALPGARTLHIVARAPAKVMAPLVAHEATHILAYDAFGPAGTSFMGEGLAVWVSNQYGGSDLADWELNLGKHPPIRELIGPNFRKTTERIAYPAAGLFVKAAVELIGIEAVAKHLLGATATTWDDACKAAGTTPDLLDKAFAAKFPMPPP